MPVAVLIVLALAGSAGAAEPDTSRGTVGKFFDQIWGSVSKTPGDTIRADGPAIQDEFLYFSGRPVRDVRVVTSDPFVGRDFERAGGLGGLLHAGNGIHRSTRAGIVHDYMLVKPGDPIDPFLLADSERLLRNTRFLHDVRILVVTLADTDSVDLVVVTRDRFSLGLGGAFNSFDDFRLDVYERNLWGLGHDFENEFDYEKGRDLELGYTGTYAVPNLGGTFVNGRAQIRDTDRQVSRTLEFSRPSVSPAIRWVGAIGVSNVDLRNAGSDTLAVPEAYVRWDAWVGYALPLGRNRAGGLGRTQLQAAARAYRIRFDERPPVDPVENRRFHDRWVGLASLSVARTTYRKANLIFGFGREEDVSEGYRFAATAGTDLGEFDTRPYVGAEATAGGYLKWGYLRAELETGGFFERGRWEDGASALRTLWFSRLHEVGSVGFRQFLETDYSTLIHNDLDVDLRLTRDQGLHGIKGDGLIGNTRLLIRTETDVFLPWSWIGFRSVVFGSLDLGHAGDSWNSFVGGKYLPVLGLGLRLNNDFLVFDTLEMRVNLFPTNPDVETSSFEIRFFPEVRFPSFAPQRPRLVRP